MSNLTAEWIDNSTLRVNWEPVQVTDRVSAAYTVNSSPIIGIADELQSLSEANVTEFQMFKSNNENFCNNGQSSPKFVLPCKGDGTPKSISGSQCHHW